VQISCNNDDAAVVAADIPLSCPEMKLGVQIVYYLID
jgi:hypothetical protein